ncbi:cytochrome P450 6j1-like [Diabrotica virgifera virgifera]|uniref:Cytochrome P450 6k1-like n=1 Tax=Diabrotica virgifera virgifera TaxID=50390 RepID=A0ABM5KUH7_DIAVI|nr:cytochrome P450 6j1-like [Diabrotica virgifera virgifera]
MSFLYSSWALNYVIFCITIFFLLYKYFTRQFDYWNKRGVYTSKPVPFFGNVFDVVIFKRNLSEHIKKLYDETDEPYFGIFVFDKPVLVLKSPKLIKDILIKDFHMFCDRSLADGSHDKTISNFVFFQKNPKWNLTRKKLTSFFTSSMSKAFFTNIELINQKFIEHLENISEPVDAKAIAGHFSTEMIARCFFATDPRCFEKEPSKFRHCVHRIFQFSVRNGLIQTFYFLKPSLIKLFKLNFLETSVMEYFHKIFLEAMECRKDYDGKPVNAVDVVNHLKKKHNGEFPDQYLYISNTMFLLVAGHETTSSAIGYALYELAVNPDIQEKLRNSVQDNYKTYEGLTYEGVQKNNYLDMVINETLRKYGLLPVLDRDALADYQFEGTDLVIEKGTAVYIPYFAMFRDPKYFPNPLKFNPERFADNTFNSDGYTFFPFGEGPRACIGKRLGLLAIAACVSNVVLKFNIEKCEATPDAIEFEPKSLALQSKDGLKIKLIARE